MRALAIAALVLVACGGSATEAEPVCREGFTAVESDDDPHDAGHGVGIYCVATDQRSVWCCK